MNNRRIYITRMLLGFAFCVFPVAHAMVPSAKRKVVSQAQRFYPKFKAKSYKYDAFRALPYGTTMQQKYFYKFPERTMPVIELPAYGITDKPSVVGGTNFEAYLWDQVEMLQNDGELPVALDISFGEQIDDLDFSFLGLLKDPENDLLINTIVKNCKQTSIKFVKDVFNLMADNVWIGIFLNSDYPDRINKEEIRAFLKTPKMQKVIAFMREEVREFKQIVDPDFVEKMRRNILQGTITERAVFFETVFILYGTTGFNLSLKLPIYLANLLSYALCEKIEGRNLDLEEFKVVSQKHKRWLTPMVLSTALALWLSIIWISTVNTTEDDDHAIDDEKDGEKEVAK